MKENDRVEALESIVVGTKLNLSEMAEVVDTLQKERVQNLWMVRCFELFKIYRFYRKLRFNLLTTEFLVLQEDLFADIISVEDYANRKANMSVDLPAEIDIMVNLCGQRRAVAHEQSVESPQDQTEFIALVAKELEQAPTDIAPILDSMLEYLSHVSLAKNIPK